MQKRPRLLQHGTKSLAGNGNENDRGVLHSFAQIGGGQDGRIEFFTRQIAGVFVLGADGWLVSGDAPLEMLTARIWRVTATPASVSRSTFPARSSAQYCTTCAPSVEITNDPDSPGIAGCGTPLTDE
mgnify:CR=1 FL=1